MTSASPPPARIKEARNRFIRLFAHDCGWGYRRDGMICTEPTALAILALRKQGLLNHERVREGLQLIMDRSIPTGGWNCGNSIIYGSTLRPQPTDTGMAPVALKGVQGTDATAASASTYLESIIPYLRAPQSLFWALPGLTAWLRRPSDAGHWIKKAYEHAALRSESAPQLSHLLLAASTRSLELMGAQADMMETIG